MERKRRSRLVCGDPHQGERVRGGGESDWSGHRQAIFRHVLPNIMAPMIVIFTVTIGDVIIAEASLTFLGLEGRNTHD